MSPAEIKIMLHYYCCPLDYSGDLAPSFVKEESDRFVRRGLLMESEVDDMNYEITEKGMFYVAEGLLKVPIPVESFKFPDVME